MGHPEVQDEQRLTPRGVPPAIGSCRAAAELIITQGLSASNMENVRRAASVSGSQLAHYFADKSALIRAVIRRQIGVVLDFHRQPKLGRPGLVRRLRTVDRSEHALPTTHRNLRWHTHLPRLGRAAGEVRRRDPRHIGGRLCAVGQVARTSHPANERSRRPRRRTPIRDIWRWLSSALIRAGARWRLPTGRSGHTPMPRGSPSTICGCSPPIPPSGSRVPRDVPVAGAARHRPAN